MEIQSRYHKLLLSVVTGKIYYSLKSKAIYEFLIILLLSLTSLLLAHLLVDGFYHAIIGHGVSTLIDASILILINVAFIIDFINKPVAITQTATVH